MPGMETAHGSIPFLLDFVIILGAAVVVTLGSHLLRVPAVIGFLLTGMLIGPHGLALVTDADLIEAFAEIGVVFLLFSVGLEFSLERLKEVRRSFFLGGALQTGGTIALAAAILIAVGRPAPLAVFYGFLVALSSTAILLKTYSDRRELDTPHGKILIGVLLFQDFLMVPMILLTPALAGEGGASTGQIAGRFGLGLLVVGLVFLAARTLMPRLLHAIVSTRLRELLVLGALLIGLGMALVTEAFGFSLALGAFLAGILVAESEYSHQVVAETTPFSQVFTSLFFISIGMLLDVEYAFQHSVVVTLAVCGVIALKAIVAGGAALAQRVPIRTAVIAGLSLAQIGEFSFVVAQVGLMTGLMPQPAYQVFLAAAIGTMLATPLLVRVAPAIGAWLQGLPFLPRPRVIDPGAPSRTTDHVVIVGYGVNGRNLARVLTTVRIPFVALELNGDTVRRARAEDVPILFGDVTRREVLEACGIERAAVLVIGITDFRAVLRAARTARAMNPDVHIIVRTRMVAEIDAIMAAGANEVVAEEFESSIEIFTRVLERFHVAPNVIEAQAKVLRGDAYRRLRGPRGMGRVSEAVLDVLAAGTTSVFYVQAGGPADGPTIGELDLRARTGVSIIAVVRDGAPRTNPDIDFQVRAGDSLVLVGSHAQITAASDLLAGDHGATGGGASTAPTTR